MFEAANRREWPLIIFTIALQFSCGLALAVGLSNFIPSEAALMRPLAIAIFPTIAVGMMASLLHLGRPLSAWKSFLNLGRSRLSLEVVLTALFAFMALIYSGYWFAGRTEARLAVGIMTAGIGLIAVGSSAVIYMVPTQRFWNSGWVPVSFLGTTLLLGGFASVTFIPRSVHSIVQSVYLGATVVGSFLCVISAFWMLRRLSEVPDEQSASARPQGALRLLSSWERSWFGLYVLLAGVLPAALAIGFWTGNAAAARSNIPFSVPVFLSVLLGAFSGRMLMYVLGTSRPRF